MNALEILARLQAVRSSSRILRAMPHATKNAVLTRSARLVEERAEELLAINAQEVAALPADPAYGEAFRDRLTLTPKRLGQMTESLKQVAALPDPVGEVVESRTLKNGLAVRRVRSPLGVILMIFESRPDVAIEAFSLAFKAGNAIVLRGGKESVRTTGVLYQILSQALEENGVSRDCLWGITDPDRKLSEFLLQQKNLIDIVVPRGGYGLIEFVTTHTRIPVIKNDRGLCHVYVHEDADLAMAEKIVVNAKTQRPGVCNAMETVLVHRKVAEALLPKLYVQMAPFQVSWFGCPETLRILKSHGAGPEVQLASESNWDTEYLDFKLNCGVVDSLEEAIAHIERHGSRHSEAIVTRSREVAAKFQSEVDAAAVYWNASTRFTDGFELGLGGELGISTQKLHVRGPVGLRELTSVRWIIDGQGQIRG